MTANKIVKQTVMQRCYIAIGSNLADPVAQALAAIKTLKQLPSSAFVSVSSLYASKPMGPQSQPDYINAVICIDTQLTPIALLDALQHIENTQGRVRAERWGARTLDLDVLLYSDQIIDTPRLTVPHYGMKVREFVLYPLAELEPELCLPSGESVTELTQQCPRNNLEIHQRVTL